MEDLKKCPFCGGEADLLEHRDIKGNSWFYVECNDFGCNVVAKTPLCFSKETAIEVWNKRVE